MGYMSVRRAQWWNSKMTNLLVFVKSVNKDQLTFFDNIYLCAVVFNTILSNASRVMVDEKGSMCD